MNRINGLLIAAAMLALTTQNQDPFDTGHKARYQPQPPNKERSTEIQSR